MRECASASIPTSLSNQEGCHRTEDRNKKDHAPTNANLLSHTMQEGEFLDR